MESKRCGKARNRERRQKSFPVTALEISDYKAYVAFRRPSKADTIYIWTFRC